MNETIAATYRAMNSPSRRSSDTTIPAMLRFQQLAAPRPPTTNDAAPIVISESPIPAEAVPL